MSQRESLTLAKDMIKLNQRQTGYAGMWLTPLKDSVANELELADPFFTPDAYLNPKSAPEVKEPIEVIRHALPDSVVVVVTSLNTILVGYDLGFKYDRIPMDGQIFVLDTDIIKE
jgi:hypothetical protein